MRRATLMLAALGLVFAGVENARAGSITVLNPGFESLVLAGPGGPGNYAFGNIPSWNVTGQTATFKPGPTEFPGGVPEGVNVAAVGNGSGISAISQTLAATLQANMTYTLTVDVGQRLDFPLNGYTIQLMAGAVTLASDSSLAPAPGTFLSDTISYISGSSPAQLGQNLTIQLSAPASGQVDFDAVTLDASPAATPEPATITLLGIGIVGMAGYGWGRRKAAAPVY